MPDLPPLESIRAFEAAARYESFVGAGQELGVTAATISHRVQALETHIGARLFTRHARGVRLNVRGREYAAEIGRIFADLRTATERHREHAEATHLKLVAVEVVAEKWLMPRLADFKAAHPAGHGAGIRQQTPGASVPGLGPAPGRRAIAPRTDRSVESQPV